MFYITKTSKVTAKSFKWKHKDSFTQQSRGSVDIQCYLVTQFVCLRSIWNSSSVSPLLHRDSKSAFFGTKLVAYLGLTSSYIPFTFFTFLSYRNADKVIFYGQRCKTHIEISTNTLISNSKARYAIYTAKDKHAIRFYLPDRTFMHHYYIQVLKFLLCIKVLSAR